MSLDVGGSAAEQPCTLGLLLRFQPVGVLQVEEVYVATAEKPVGVRQRDAVRCKDVDQGAMNERRSELAPQIITD